MIDGDPQSSKEGEEEDEDIEPVVEVAEHPVPRG